MGSPFRPRPLVLGLEAGCDEYDGSSLALGVVDKGHSRVKFVWKFRGRGNPAGAVVRF